MKISAAAKASGLTAKTIRYYESIGLLGSHRLDNGYRDYTDRDIQSLRFLCRARSLGFGLEDCRSLLELQKNPQRASAAVKTVAEHRLAHIEEQMQALMQMRETLALWVAQCPGNETAHCAILDHLSELKADR